MLRYEKRERGSSSQHHPQRNTPHSRAAVHVYPGVKHQRITDPGSDLHGGRILQWLLSRQRHPGRTLEGLQSEAFGSGLHISLSLKSMVAWHGRRAMDTVLASFMTDTSHR